MNPEEYLPIYPNLKRIINIVKFKYTILEIQLFTSVRVAVYLYNEHDSLIEATQFIIKDEDKLAYYYGKAISLHEQALFFRKLYFEEKERSEK